MRPGDQPTVLVADDDDEFRDFLRAALSTEPFRVLMAKNGIEALEMVRKHLPNLVLLDIGMPLMDGYEVCRRLKESPDTRHIPVLVVTARSEEQDILRGFQEGADDFLSKPFSIAHLKAKIRIWVSRAHQADSR